MFCMYADRVLLDLGSAHTIPQSWYNVRASLLVHFLSKTRRLSTGVEVSSHCRTVSGWSLSLGSDVDR